MAGCVCRTQSGSEMGALAPAGALSRLTSPLAVGGAAATDRSLKIAPAAWTRCTAHRKHTGAPYCAALVPGGRPAPPPVDACLFKPLPGPSPTFTARSRTRIPQIVPKFD